MIENKIDRWQLRSLLRKTAAEFGVSVGEQGSEQMAIHFALLLKWSLKISLTSLTRPEEIAARHFGESLFLVKLCNEPGDAENGLMVDVGSGAGFPGLPLKVVWPEITTVLLEPNQKKATFLKEVVRSAGIARADIYALRLEEALASGNPAARILCGQASLVTMRAVGVTTPMLDYLRKLLQPGGRLALFLGDDHAQLVQKHGGFEWASATSIPFSERRVILIGRLREARQASEK